MVPDFGEKCIDCIDVSAGQVYYAFEEYKHQIVNPNGEIKTLRFD